MEHEESPAPAATEADAAAEALQPRPIRAWPGLLLVGVYWAFSLSLNLRELPISTTFLNTAGACALLTLLFPIWWLVNRTVGLGDRLWSLLALVLGAAAAIVASRQTMGTISVLLFGLPVAFTAWSVGLLIARWTSRRYLRAGLILASSLIWGFVCLLRMDGLTGDLKPDIRWRWSPSDEDVYLAERSQNAFEAADGSQAAALEVRPGDWPAYRGPQRNGEVRGLEISTSWNAQPPKLVWRQRIGPAWSSMLVIDGRLFTQEQAGEAEAVVCLDAETGRRVWTHEDAARFWDSQSGAGPRATPAFAEGCIYAQGATGILNCLDAATGKVRWSRNVMEDSGASLPMWGFSSSPLVAEGVVIAYAGGKADKRLLAYRTADGELAWTASAGPTSYTSPQPAEFGGKPQALFLSDLGLVALDPATGKECWRYDAATPGVWRAVQPAVLGPADVLIASEDLGTVLLKVSEQEGRWNAERKWSSRAMKPGYNDFVIYDGFAYGFDGGAFCCLDVKTGKRRWRRGRYGRGQTLLLADQGLLLVSSETGEAVLLEATPEAHRELGRFQAIEGKTWNHPAIAQDCLFMRNDQEIACYRLHGSSETSVSP
ncbi:MAG TPA: PQQ-binding-like beta-propeller repeat protein [Pirellulales bacterium]|nr:PQQ-binding-like beta-propeller repeat protein [Pirellulales bacterium]